MLNGNLYLLANPQYKKRKYLENTSIDDNILTLFNIKFDAINITRNNYNENITKIENIFLKYSYQEIIKGKVEQIIEEAINGQILF